MTELIHFSETDLSDFSKDAYGFRCRTYKEWWSKDELEAEYKRLSAICEDNYLADTKRESEALVQFEILIKRTINYGAADRETAIKWLVQGEGLEFNEYDLQYFFWGHGLSYEIQNKWAKELCNA
jgi:hypothetical protein